MDAQINITDAREFLVKLLPKAGEILLNYFGSETLKSHSKGGVDFATEADLAVDEFLRTQIQKNFPILNF